MLKQGKRIKEEFGFVSEAQAVKDYHLLQRDLMYANYPLIADELIARLRLSGGAILDVGTGLGSLALAFAERLPESRVYGIDISPQMLEAARAAAQGKGLNNVQFLCGDAQQIVFPDNFFDLVVSFGVLHHLPDLRRAFSEIKRVLKGNHAAYVYDLRKDAPQSIVTEIAAGMSPTQRQAFWASVKAAYEISELEAVVRSLGVRKYALSGPKFARQTIIKNIRMLKESKFSGERFNHILVEISLVK